MKISRCDNRPALVPCSLNGFDYQVDPYIGCEHYCRYCYVLDQAETDWTKEILIHADLIGQLRSEISRLEPQTVYMGYLSDPYQPCESEVKQTRDVLELFVEKGFSASILTKSDLVLRDIDLLQRVGYANVSMSVAFNDDRVLSFFEANTVATSRRVDALKKLRDAGLGTSAMICPVIPHITDTMSLIDALAPIVDTIWIYGLSIQSESQQGWSNVRRILDQHFTDAKQEIESTLADSDHPYWRDLRQDLLQRQERDRLDLRVHV